MKKVTLFVGIILTLTVFLVACGDAPTPAPTLTTAARLTTAAATTAAATTAVPTTAVATTAVATTAVATTAVATTAAANTTQAAASSSTTAAGTTTSPASGNSSAPPAPDLTEVPLDPALLKATTAGLAGVSNVQVKLFVSTDIQDKVVSFIDEALSKDGYVFAIPGLTKPISTGDSTVALYSKAGQPDDLFFASNIPATDAEINKSVSSVPGITQAGIDQYTNAVKGKKTQVLEIAGTGLVKSYLAATSSGGANATGTSGTTTSGAASSTPTSASTTVTAETTAGAQTTQSTGTIPVYPGAESLVPTKEVTDLISKNSSSVVKITSLNTYKTGDAAANVKTFYTDYFNQNNYTITSAAQGTDDTYTKLGGFQIVANKGANVITLLAFGGPAARAAFNLKESDLGSSDLFFILVELGPA